MSYYDTKEKEDLIKVFYDNLRLEFVIGEKLLKKIIENYLEIKENKKNLLRYLKRADYLMNLPILVRIFKDDIKKYINEQIEIIINNLTPILQKRIIEHFKINNNDFKIYYKYIIKDFQEKLNEIFKRKKAIKLMLTDKSIDNKFKDILDKYKNGLNKLINNKCNDNKNDFNDNYKNKDIIDITEDFINLNDNYNLMDKEDMMKINSLIIMFYNSEIYDRKNELKKLLMDFQYIISDKLDNYNFNYYNELFNEILDYLKNYKDEWYCPSGKIKINKINNIFYGGIMLFDFKIFIFVILVILIILIIIIVIIKIKK